jgi:protein-L-isoaspartate O-methyltransferase
MTRVRILFGGVVFLASFLLFLVEPIAAKQLLPVLGGSAAVWITCLVFFQTALLCAYLYAHWLAQRARWILHFALLLIASASAIAWAARSVVAGSGAAHPFTTIFVALTISIGLPFLALGATSPLMQVWWSRLYRAGIPYRLFALSNLASLLALGLYPTVIEPNLTLKMQRIAWCCGFAVFAIASGVLAWRTRTATEAEPQAGTGDPVKPAAGARDKLLWLLLPMGAAMQLSAVTSFITANVAAIPLLWILPLAVYLISLIIAFQFPRLAPRSIVTRLLIVMLAGLGYMLSQEGVTHPLVLTVGFLLLELFASCLFCHCEAYAIRPVRVTESTKFYLLFAAGGALGSFLIGIVAPLVYRYNFDLAITFLITALLALAATWRDGWNQRLLWSVAGVLMALLVSWIHTATVRGSMVVVRNFYGSLRVKQDHGYPGATLRTLMNGTIQHGTQIFGTDELRKTPTTYYAEDSGVGLALRLCCADRPRSIGVIGLGAGTVAAYGKAGDRIRFYEINPAVVPIAKNVFTYIRESGAQITIVEGDGRTSLAQEAPQGFDVLVVDAFSGDAIPLHLLTKEAVDLYKKHLAPGGVIAFHISNQHVNLEAPIALLAKDAKMRAVRVSTISKPDRGEFNASWMLVSDNPAFFAESEVLKAGRMPEEKPGLKLWTDDFSSLLPVLSW